MFGVLTIAVRIYHDRRGYGVYSGPVGTAVLIIAAKWVRTGQPSTDGPSPVSPFPPTSWAGSGLPTAEAKTHGKGPGGPATQVWSFVSGPKPSCWTSLTQFPYL